MGLLRLLKNDLAMETRTWTEKGLISEDQAAAICRTYGIDYFNMDQRSRGYWILVILGYLFIGLALITLISANWDEIPRGVRMGGLILLTLATHLLGLVKTFQGKELPAVGFFFLGSLFYGISIMLIAQIYHIGEHFPDGILFWALGVLPLALLLRSKVLMLLAVTLGTIWFMVEAYLGYFPWLYPLFLGAMAWHLLRVGPGRLLFFMLILLTGLFLELCISWGISGWDRLGFDLENLFFAGGWCLVCFGLARYLGAQDRPDFKDYATITTLWALRFFVFVLFVLSFEDAWKELIKEPWLVPEAALAMAGILGAATLGLAWAGDRKVRSMAAPALAVLIFLGYMAGLVLTSEREYAIWFTITDNIILVITGVWLIVSGIRRAVSHYFFLGVVVVLLTGLIRYLDLVGDYIGAAAMFLGFAVILLAAARFWKTHTRGDAI